jgi:hypothetical protein
MAKKNPYLKSANAEDTYTYDEITELKKCYEDPVYFINNYVKIVHPTKGTVPFKLFDYQEEMVRAFHEERYTIVLSARQTGKCVTYETQVNVIDKSKISWFKKLILKLFDKNLYDRLYSTQMQE